MSKQRIFQIFLIGLLSSTGIAEPDKPVPDRIEVHGGAVLTGMILESSAEVIRLQTEYAGILEVQTSKIREVVTNKNLSGKLPDGLLVSKPSTQVARKVTPPAKQPTQPVAKPPVAAKKPPPKAAPTKKYGWQVEAGMNLTGNDGNSEKLDIGLNVDTRFLQKYYRVDLYGRYNYGTNRDKLTSDEIVLGSRYTNFFYKRFGWFVREELERDKFELIDFRSTTASGFSYKIFDKKNLDLEARSGLSYRYEIDDEDDQEDFPGMDFGMDVHWQLAPILSFKGSYGFIPSFNDSEEFIVTQNSGFDIPISKNSPWKIRLGLTTKYNNLPSKKRKKLDHKYYLRLIASWK